MAKTVQVLFTSRVEGGGFNLSGVAKNNKAYVVARVTTTDVQSGVESLTPNDLGLSTIDFIKVDMHGTTGGVPAKSVGASIHADYDHTNQQLVLTDIAQTGARTQITNDEDPVIDVLAFGDSNAAPDLV